MSNQTTHADYAAVDPADLPRLLRQARSSEDDAAVAMLASRKAYLIRRNAMQLDHMRDSEQAARIFGMTPRERESHWASLGMPFAGIDGCL